MRIGIRVSPRSSGGGRAFVENLCRELADVRGCDRVHTFVMGDLETSSFDLPDQIAVPVPADPLRRRLQGRRALTDAVAENPVDVLVAPGNEVSRVPGVPTLMWPLTVAPFEYAAMAELGSTLKERVRWRALRQAIRTAAKQADGFVFSSHYTRALYREGVPVVRGATTTVIPPASTVLADSRGSEIPGLPDEYLLFVSHLYPYKMVVEMIEGYALAHRSGVSQHLVIAGNAVNPSYSARIDETIRLLGVGDVVHLLGGVPQADLPALYQGAELFLFPSLSENAGSFAVIDAFTFGLPVLASGMSSVPEACQDAARYFDPRDPEQLSAEIRRVTSDPDVRADLARRSNARAGEYLGWRQIAEALVEFAHRVHRNVHP